MIPVMLFSACAPEPQPPSAEQLEMSVREILELPTYEQVYRDIVYVGEKQKVLFITTIDKEVLFSIDIRVQAGVKNTDLIDVEITGNNENGMKTAVVYIPDTEILLVDADESSIEQYFLKEKGEEISRLEYYDEINRKKRYDHSVRDRLRPSRTGEHQCENAYKQLSVISRHRGHRIQEDCQWLTENVKKRDARASGVSCY